MAYQILHPVRFERAGARDQEDLSLGTPTPPQPGPLCNRCTGNVVLHGMGPFDQGAPLYKEVERRTHDRAVLHPRLCAGGGAAPKHSRAPMTGDGPPMHIRRFTHPHRSARASYTHAIACFQHMFKKSQRPPPALGPVSSFQMLF